MPKRNLSSRRRKELRHAERRRQNMERNLPKHKRYNPKDNSQSEDNNQREDNGQRILFYGRPEWYKAVVEALELNGECKYLPFGEVPDELGTIDMVIVDAAKVDGQFPAEAFLKEAQRRSTVLIEGTQLCLSYQDTCEHLREFALPQFTYDEFQSMKRYLSNFCNL